MNGYNKPDMKSIKIAPYGKHTFVVHDLKHVLTVLHPFYHITPVYDIMKEQCIGEFSNVDSGKDVEDSQWLVFHNDKLQFVKVRVDFLNDMAMKIVRFSNGHIDHYELHVHRDYYDPQYDGTLQSTGYDGEYVREELPDLDSSYVFGPWFDNPITTGIVFSPLMLFILYRFLG